MSIIYIDRLVLPWLPEFLLANSKQLFHGGWARRARGTTDDGTDHADRGPGAAVEAAALLPGWRRPVPKEAAS